MFTYCPPSILSIAVHFTGEICLSGASNQVGFAVGSRSTNIIAFPPPMQIVFKIEALILFSYLPNVFCMPDVHFVGTIVSPDNLNFIITSTTEHFDSIVLLISIR